MKQFDRKEKYLEMFEKKPNNLSRINLTFSFLVLIRNRFVTDQMPELNIHIHHYPRYTKNAKLCEVVNTKNASKLFHPHPNLQN